nr:translation initiation factor IF-2-like [Macaca fascicularis]
MQSTPRQTRGAGEQWGPAPTRRATGTPRAGPRGIAAGAKPPVPHGAETKPRRKDPGSRPRTLRSGARTLRSRARSRHTRGRDAHPVWRPRRPWRRLTSGRRLAALAPRRGAWADWSAAEQPTEPPQPQQWSPRAGPPPRRFSPCCPLRIRLGSRSCSWRGAAARKHTLQVHTALPASRRPAPPPAEPGAQGPPPGQGGASCAEKVGPGGTKGGWAGRRWDWACGVPREDRTQELAGSWPPGRPSSTSTWSLLYRTRSSQAQNSGF